MRGQMSTQKMLTWKKGRGRRDEVSKQHSKVPDIFSLALVAEQTALTRHYGQFPGTNSHTTVSFLAVLRLDQCAFSHTILHYSINIASLSSLFFTFQLLPKSLCYKHNVCVTSQTFCLWSTYVPKNQ